MTLGSALHVAGFRRPAPVQTGPVAPFAVEFDPVRRIGDQQQRPGIAQQPCNHIRLCAVAADDTMTAEDEQIAGPRDRIRLHLGNRVFIDETRRGILRFEQSLEFHVLEAEQIEVVAFFVQGGQFEAKRFFIPPGTCNRHLVSAITRARRCDSDRCRSTMTGISSIPSLRAARTLACPARMPSSPSTKTGFVQPNSLIEAAIWATCSRLWVRGLLARGISFPIGQRSISMAMFGGTDVRSMCFAIDISNIEPLVTYTKRRGQSSTEPISTIRVFRRATDLQRRRVEDVRSGES
jgi:hypothetical protein